MKVVSVTALFSAQGPRLSTLWLSESHDLLVTAINYLSVQLSGAIQVLLTSLKVGAIVLIVVGGILPGTKHSQAARLDIPSVSAPLAMGTIGVLLTALVPAMWAYNGFNDLGDLGEEILHPQKNIPRAIILGLLTVGGLYLLANVVYFRILPFAAVATSQHVASRSEERRVGDECRPGGARGPEK